ncbi:MAG: LytTR family transcriptional regulator, partial [Clostridiales bacterium]|nr:LytTR family transcriptional regulator [Clostridiales bacterium]
LRISKSVILNIMKADSIKPALNGRFRCKLTNGEDVIISRKYVSEFREYISRRSGK